jgi:hypothetical protein
MATNEELAGIGDHGYNGNSRNHSVAIMAERSAEEDALDTMLETSVIELDEALKMGSSMLANDTVSTAAAASASLVGLDPIVVGGSGMHQWANTISTAHLQESPTASLLFFQRSTCSPTRNAFLAKDEDETTYQSLVLQTSPLSNTSQQQQQQRDDDEDDDEDDEGAPMKSELPPAAAPVLDDVSPAPVRVEIIQTRPTSTSSVVVAVPRSGRWTLDEKVLFLYGLQKYGRGKWKQIQCYCPGR